MNIMDITFNEKNIIYLSTPIQSMQYEILEILKKQFIEKVEILQERTFNCISFLNNGYYVKIDNFDLSRAAEFFILNNWIDIQKQLEQQGLYYDAFSEWDLMIYTVALDRNHHAHIVFHINDAALSG
jgi:hypothetical protein